MNRPARNNERTSFNERTSISAIQQIRQHSRQLVRELNILKGVYLDTGYTFTQCHVLFELSLHPLTLLELAERLLMDKSNTSRTVKRLVEQGLVQIEKVSGDQRQKLFRLTTKGLKALSAATDVADLQVSQALQTLDPDQQQQVVQGLQLYSEALRKSRLQQRYEIRSLGKRDNEAVARLIRSVMTEYQAVGPGYSIDDPEVDDMYGHYRGRESCYLVITRDQQIVGGGGIGPLQGGNTDTCELRKMFFRPDTRGLGLGRQLLTMLMEQAWKREYRQCYLETLDRMWRTNQLYRKFGFQPLDQPLGNTGHCACDRWYLLSLDT